MAGFSVADYTDPADGQVKQRVVDANAVNDRPNIKWSDEVSRKFLDRYLSEDVGTGLVGNGKESDEVAHSWIGRGIKQITHVSNYAEFFLEVSQKWPKLLPTALADLTTVAEIQKALIDNAKNTSILDGSKIVDALITNKDLAAISAAWFWKSHNAKGGIALNTKANSIEWNIDKVNPDQRTEFDKISKGINGGTAGIDERWRYYTDNVEELLKGGNPYESMREALSRLGVSAVAGNKEYSQQFGISLAARKAVDIEGNGSNNLFSASGEVMAETPDGLDLTVEQQAQLWAQAEPLLAQLKQSTKEKSAMFIPNIGQTAGLLLGAAVAVSASPAKAAENYVLGVCQVTQANVGAGIRPATDGDIYLYTYLVGDSRYQGFSFNSDDVKVTLVKAPAHGKVVREESSVSMRRYHYTPSEGYVGQDRFVMQVEKNGVKVRIQYLLEIPLEDEPTGHMCNPEHWKISATTPALDIASLQALLGAANIDNSVNITFSDLAGGALGQTTGTSITLDDNAAGHNWFIDTTPADNSEFLSTSNPYEWVAKEGSAAYGKMDMLSVLLHEYGHALGIEHSADAHDYMGTTLTAGVRRMPSAEELALMQELVSGVKTEMAVNTQNNNAPTQLPLLPLGGFGLAFLGRLRSSRYGSINIEADLSTLVTQYAVTANAKLLNGTFTAVNNLPVDNGWATQGSVDFANGAATLKEVSTSQTRLNQVFVVNPRDRFLSFTIAGSVLDDVNGAPDDAFEAALLDANTGLSLAGAFSLSHSDAMLNLQANGTETAASSVTRVINVDGSRTYRVDLSGIAAGTAVNLSFDLIGFGKNNSQVTVRDVRVSGLPELHDDVATMNEDGSLPFNPFAQVDNAALLQLGSHVVDQPGHGIVTVNADGTFAYTPAANFFGTDSFTYRLNDGPLESNLATVSVSVTAVNDAPVAGDVYATLAEDTPLEITLGAHATDVENSPLTIQIVDGPTHGVLVANADGSYTYTVEANYNGADSFTYKANDGDLGSNVATVNINITPVNDAPVANDIAVYTLEDNTLVLDLRNSASDIDTPVFTASIVAAPAHGVLSWNTDGSYTYTPDANYNGADSFTYKVNDGELDSNVATVSLTVGAVNDAPVVTNAAVTTLEDTAIVIDLRTYASDVDSTDFTPTIVTGPAHGVLVANADGTYSYTPAANYFGTDSFTYKVNDGSFDSNIAAVSLTVTSVNDAPIVANAVVTTQEDTALLIDLRTYASDVDSTEFIATIVDAPTHGILIQNTDGTYSYTPEANYNGTDSFTYKVNDGELDSNVASVNLTVTSVNDAPIVANAAVTTQEDTAIVIDLRTYATDVDSTVFTAQIVTGPAHGVLLANADGTYSYTPAANYFGTDSFTYKVNDGMLDSNVATVNLTVTAVNDAPVAVDMQVATNEDTPLTLNLLASVVDVDSTALTAILVAGPQHGQLLQNTDGSFNYVSDLNYFGTDSFTWKANDGASTDINSALDSNIVTVSLTINAVNDAPVAVSASVAGLEDTPYIFNWSDFCVSDVDSSDTSTGLRTGLAHQLHRCRQGDDAGCGQPEQAVGEVEGEGVGGFAGFKSPPAPLW